MSGIQRASANVGKFYVQPIVAAKSPTNRQADQPPLETKALQLLGGTVIRPANPSEARRVQEKLSDSNLDWIKLSGKDNQAVFVAGHFNNAGTALDRSRYVDKGSEYTVDVKKMVLNTKDDIGMLKKYVKAQANPIDTLANMLFPGITNPTLRDLDAIERNLPETHREDRALLRMLVD